MRYQRCRRNKMLISLLIGSVVIGIAIYFGLTLPFRGSNATK